MATPRAPGRRRVWLTLLGAPLVLALVFGAFAAFLRFARGVPEAELVQAIERDPAAPAVIAFALLFVIARWVARKDGLTLRDLGWSRPSPLDLLAGVALAALMCAANAWALYPLVQRASPSFDPTLASVALAPAVVMMAVAAVAEDTLYRGYAFVALRTRHGPVLAVVVTSLFYALLAPGPDLALKAWALLFGLLLAALRLWRGNLWPVVLAHVTVSLAPKVYATIVA